MAGTNRTIVYVDAFNLYFGSLKGTANRWLNLEALSKAYLPHNDIVAIKYFTAKVSARPSDPQQPARQQAYIRALETIPCAKIIYGHYLSHEVMARLANPPAIGSAYVKIIKTEEKGSDVNLASHLLNDAHLNRFDVAVVISNDSDLREPIRLARYELGKIVGVLNPHQKQSQALKQVINFYKPIRASALAACQFSDELIAHDGSKIHKPATW